MKNLVKIIFSSIIIVVLTFIACKKTLQEIPTINNSEIEMRQTENVYDMDYIVNFLELEEEKDWSEIEDSKLIYSIGKYTDNTYIINYSTSDQSKEVIKSNIISILKKDEKFIDYSGDLGNRINSLFVELGSFETIDELINLNDVTSIEPSAELIYNNAQQFQDWFHSEYRWVTPYNLLGCHCDMPIIDPDDYEIITPNLGNVNGSINDGFYYGNYPWREEFRENFLQATIITSNLASTIDPSINIPIMMEKIFHPPGFVTSDDRCGHGTRIAGLIGGPRGNDGNATGIAYGCDLYNLRALHSAIIQTNSEKWAVTQALYYAGDHADINIISMSCGFPPFFTNQNISDAIDEVFNEGKMINCAAGTGIIPVSTTVFPASHPLTNAITGLRDIADLTNTNVVNDNICSCCFYGSGIDFAVIMQKSDNFSSSHTTLAATCSGDEPGYLSCASAATASFSAMAAMVWEFLGSTATATDVYLKLVDASKDPTGNHPHFGHGWIDMEAALQ